MQFFFAYFLLHFFSQDDEVEVKAHGTLRDIRIGEVELVKPSIDSARPVMGVNADEELILQDIPSSPTVLTRNRDEAFDSKPNHVKDLKVGH